MLGFTIVSTVGMIKGHKNWESTFPPATQLSLTTAGPSWPCGQQAGKHTRAELPAMGIEHLGLLPVSNHFGGLGKHHTPPVSTA